VAVIVTSSPTATMHFGAVLQSACGLESVIVAVPSRPDAAVIVTVGVTKKFAVSVSVCVAANWQGLASGAHEPPDQPLSWLPESGFALIVIASPTSTRQLEALAQLAIGLASVTVAVPLPVLLAVIVTVTAKLAVSVSVAEALNEHGLVTPVQVPPDQLARRLPKDALGVMMIASPTLARQLEALAQLAIGLASVTVTVPLPVTAAVIVTVLAKLAVSVSVLAAVKVQGFETPEQVPPDQLASRLPEDATGVIVIASPTSARQLETLLQPATGFESLIVAVPLPVTAAVIVIVFAKFAVSVSVFAALNVQGLLTPEQVPPDQLASRLPDVAAGVIVIESPTWAMQ
jgi:phosphoribosyl-dephospho-CoA transferase